MINQSETKESRGLSLTEKIKNIAYNAKYAALKYFEEYDRLSILDPSDQIYILGSKYACTSQNVKEVNEEVYEVFNNISWLTYRTGFPQLKNEVQGTYVSDTGWGCMVRVGQMLFAQIIKHHSNMKTKEQTLRVLELFNDFDKCQPFSIQNIARVARIQYGLKPGQWYNPSQISHIVNHLYEESLGAETKLKFCIFNSGNLFFDNIVNNMVVKRNQCKCEQKQEKFLCEKCNQVKNSVTVIILTRLGLQTPEIKYLDILDKLIEFPEFQGILGGKPEKALYLVGKQGKHYIYLDPHYVQNAQKDLKIGQNSYFCDSFRKCKNTSIDSSMGICFYMRNIQQLNSFYRNINKIKQQYIEDFFIFVADETPSYMKAPKKLKIQQRNQDEDVFQSL